MVLDVMFYEISFQENLGADLGFDLGLAAAPAPQNGLDGTADFFVITLTRTPRVVGTLHDVKLHWYSSEWT